MLRGEMGNRNIHVWKHVTDDGEKREVRAEKFGSRWRIQAKLKHDERWTYYEDPELADLIELRRVLWNKYQRKHLAYEDVAAVEKMIRERGGSWENTDDGEDSQDAGADE
jgi:hypothetical protein